MESQTTKWAWILLRASFPCCSQSSNRLPILAIVVIVAQLLWRVYSNGLAFNLVQEHCSCCCCCCWPWKRMIMITTVVLLPLAAVDVVLLLVELRQCQIGIAPSKFVGSLVWWLRNPKVCSPTSFVEWIGANTWNRKMNARRRRRIRRQKIILRPSCSVHCPTTLMRSIQCVGVFFTWNRQHFSSWTEPNSWGEFGAKIVCSLWLLRGRSSH